MFNEILISRINKFFGSQEQIPSELIPFLKSVSDGYNRFENELHALEKRNGELDQFAYVVAHDLKAPLRAISSLSTWIEDDLGSNISNEIKQNFETLKSRITRMENLINGILEYSKAAKTGNIEKVDSGTLVREIIQSFNCPENFEIRIGKNFPVLQTEKIKLEQVFSNLINNAIKHNARKNAVIEIGCADFEDWCQFYVKDNGHGIDPQFHQKIFVIFQTLQSRDKMESTGIGLSIVKKIVEEQGGKVWVESEPGNGARFEFIWTKHKSEIRQLTDQNH
ncbi:MAG: ATP-binding protein [Bacteroidia bacterium]